MPSRAQAGHQDRHEAPSPALIHPLSLQDEATPHDRSWLVKFIMLPGRLEPGPMDVAG